MNTPPQTVDARTIKFGRRNRILLQFFAAFVVSASAVTANDELWQLAAEAYQSGHAETGHIHLKALVAKNSGDVDLAIKCLGEILKQARRIDANRLAQQPHLTFVDNPTAEYAARQLCALERVGAVSANRRSVQDAVTVLVDHNMRHGRLFEAMEMIDRFVEENSHDPFWRIQQARVYRMLDSSKTRPLFDRLRNEMDLDHPDLAARQRWSAFAVELDAFGDKLPQEIRPLPKGSPLPLMNPDDPDGEWGLIANRSTPAIIDRLAGRSFVNNDFVPWRDSTGFIDAIQTIDLHLLSQPRADLEPLRRVQAGRFAQENIGSAPSDDIIVSMSRRYAWAQAAQQRLKEFANRMLFAGRSHSALRSFQDLLSHATDKETLDVAQVGIWAARSQIENPESVDQLLGDVDPDRVFSWLGNSAKASEICRQIIENLPHRITPPAAASTLKDLAQHIIRIPPVSPWSSDLQSEVDLAVVERDLLVSGRDLLVMYDAQQPRQPVWRNLQPLSSGKSTRGNNHPGYFRPQFDGDLLYTRWGFSSNPPHGIAGVDRSTGNPLWTNDTSSPDRRPLDVPLSDPVLADGLLFYLQWKTQGNVNHGRQRRLSLVCFDPGRRRLVWDYTIATGGHNSDVTASLERALPASAIYGNRVTLHEGAVYSSSNCGIVARSDVRDGRTDWVHHYRPIDIKRRNVANHGAAPIIAGDHVICMPKDSNRVFALDQRTGRLVWENTMVLGVQMVGVLEDLLIVRGQTNVAGLDLATGEARWYRPTDKGVLGRASLFGSSVCIAQFNGLLRIDSKTGQLQEVRPWGLKDEKPRNFTIHGRNLYVVTDKPSQDFGRQIDQPLNPAVPDTSAPLQLPLARTWTLPRENAKITLPPKGSELEGTAYVFSEGILEQIDLTAQGRIRWQRFVAAHAPEIHFIGKTMLVVDHSSGHAPGVENRVVAFDATDGRTLWEHVIGAPVNELLNCGPTQVFHNATGRIVALDVATGRRAWERNLGDGFQMRLSWDGKHVHIFFVSRLRAAHHLVVDAQSGSTVDENTIAAKSSADAKNANYIKGGYYEVIIKPARARYVRLVALSEINGRGWASISELQVVDGSGNNFPRDNWSATASNSETKARYDTSPKCVIDGDPVTWWHSQWLGAIPPHPHAVTIDMGAEQMMTGIRYLPAVIVNNNGMIRDYELYVSQDGQNWGDPVAKGFLVNRTRVDQAYASAKSIVFESRASPNKPLGIYRYPLDGKEAVLVRKNAHIVYFHEPYFFTIADKNLVVHRFDDSAYQFQLGSSEQFDTSFIELENDRLVLGRKGILVADLANKRFIVAPSDAKLKYNQEGVVLRDGADSLLKIVALGDKGKDGQAVFRFDLRTGSHTEAVLSEEPAQFQLGHHGPGRSIQHFDGLVLLNDNSSVSAWIGSLP